MKNISREIAKNQLKGWKTLNSDDRDKIVFEAFFSRSIEESIPMFSNNIKDSIATERLITKLKKIGIENISVEQLPRSTLSIVKFDGITLPAMPAHKAIGYIGYLMSTLMENYIAIIHKDANSEYGVIFPDFPGCTMATTTIDEAKDMAQETLQSHVDALIEDKEALPVPSRLEDVQDNTAVAYFIVTAQIHRTP